MAFQLTIPTGGTTRTSGVISEQVGPIIAQAYNLVSATKCTLQSSPDGGTTWGDTGTTDDRDVLIEGNAAKKFNTAPGFQFRFVISGGTPTQRDAITIWWAPMPESTVDTFFQSPA